MNLTGIQDIDNLRPIFEIVLIATFFDCTKKVAERNACEIESVDIRLKKVPLFERILVRIKLTTSN
jgi:hypothetical protein